MRLNLGCGTDLRPGWLNVDCRPLHPEGGGFRLADLAELDGVVTDGGAEEIDASDVLEYVPWRTLDAVLVLLGRKLARGGVLTLRVPDHEAALRAWAEGRLDEAAAERVFYGDQAHPADTRRSLWGAEAVRRRLAMIGLAVERLECWDGRVVARGRRPA